MNDTSEKLKAFLDRHAGIPDGFIPGNLATEPKQDDRLTFGDLRRLHQLDKLVWTLVEAVENHGAAFYNQDAWHRAYDALRVTLGGDSYYGVYGVPPWPEPSEESE